MKITIYTMPTCPKCTMVKTKLKQRGIEYEECQDLVKMQELGIRSAPTLEVDGKLYRNLNEINDYVNAL